MDVLSNYDGKRNICVLGIHYLVFIHFRLVTIIAVTLGFYMICVIIMIRHGMILLESSCSKHSDLQNHLILLCHLVICMENDN